MFHMTLLMCCKHASYFEYWSHEVAQLRYGAYAHAHTVTAIPASFPLNDCCIILQVFPLQNLETYLLYHVARLRDIELLTDLVFLTNTVVEQEAFYVRTYLPLELWPNITSRPTTSR